MRKIVLVMGMHRSATSLTTEILASYGLYIGSKEDLWEPAQDNQRGYFENKYAVLLNDKILYEHKMHWASLNGLEAVTNTEYTDRITEILRDMLKKAGQDQSLLLKDPRMCLLEPVWKKQFEAAGLKEHIVMVFRHPYEVAESLQIRDKIRFSYALKMWFFNNYCALCSIASCDTPAVILNHNDYFIAYEKQIGKIEAFLHWTGKNKKLAEIVDASLRHNHANRIQQNIDPELDRIVLDMYQYLLNLSQNGTVFISQDKLKDYSDKLKIITSNAYLLDKEPIIFRDCLGKEKKAWCTYQLKHNFEMLVHKFCQWRERQGIVKCSIYGNGTLTEMLLPILIKAEICVEIIYDQKPAQNKLGQAQYPIKIENINAVKDVEGVLLNTVVYYGIRVADELSERFALCNILDLYELMYDMLKNDLYNNKI